MSTITQLKPLRNAVSATAMAAAMLAATQAQASVTISSDATSNMKCASGICAPTAAKAVLNVSDLQNLLAAGDLKVTTGSGNLASKVEDIAVAAALTWASSHGLTLDAYRSIVITKPVSVAGPGALTLITNDGGKNGTLSFAGKGNIGFLGLANTLTINGATYTLLSDIDTLAADIAKKPSGRFALTKGIKSVVAYSLAPVSTPFTGTFEGLGNTISGLTVNSTAQNVGLFADIGVGGMVRDLGVVNANMTGPGTDLSDNVGGIAGLNEGTIAQSYASGVIGNPAESGSVGGIAGANNAQSPNTAVITGCHVTSAQISGGFYVGGLVGDSNGMVSLSYTTATVAVAAYFLGGGLVGQNEGTILQSYATGSAAGSYGGGLAGRSDGVIQQSYATGSTFGSTAVGGLVGYNNNTASIYESYAHNAVAAKYNVGGVIGQDNSNATASSYWDTQTCNCSTGIGENGNNDTVTGLTDSQFQAGLPGGLSPSVWAEKPGVNGGFPYLKALPPK